MTGSKHVSDFSRAANTRQVLKSAVQPTTRQLAQFEALETRSLFTAVAVDPAFGSTGLVQTTFNGANANPTGITVLKDGRPLVTATTDTDVVAVYNANGSLSSAFNGNGELILSSAQTAKLNPEGLSGSFNALQTPDGGILLIGSSGVLKLKLNGTIDTSFGQSGFASVPTNSIKTSKLLSDGTYRSVTIDSSSLHIQDLSATGQVTRSLSKTVNLSSFYVNGISVDDTGVLLITTAKDLSSANAYCFNLDLTPAASFGSNGVVNLTPAFNSWAVGYEPWYNPFGGDATTIPEDLTLTGFYSTKSGYGIAGTVGLATNTLPADEDQGVTTTYINFDISADGKTVNVYGAGTDPNRSSTAVFSPNTDDHVVPRFGGVFETSDGSVISFNPFAQNYQPRGYVAASAVAPDGSYYIVGNTSIIDSENDDLLIVAKTAPLQNAANTATIDGQLYNDDNGDGDFYTGDGETVNAGKTVYIDSNNNGKLDAGERSTVTDQYGRYIFTNVAPGTYHIRRVIPSGYQQTTTDSPVTVSNGDVADYDIGSTARALIAVTKNFADSSYGTVFVDSNRNGVYDGSDTYISFGSLSQIALPAGTYRIAVEPDLNSAVKSGTPSYYDVTVKNNTKTTLTLSLVHTADSGEVSGVVDYQNANDPTAYPYANETIFVDLNKNGVLDAGEPSAISRDSDGKYFLELRPGTYRIAAMAPVGMHALNNLSGYADVTVTSDQTTTLSWHFARNATGTVSGRVYRQNSASETPVGTSNDTLFVDLNKNGIQDAGEPTAVTDINGYYSFSLQPGSYRIVVQKPASLNPVNYTSGYADVTVTSGQTTNVSWQFADNGAYPAKITGQLFNDDNFDGARESSETVNANRVVYIDANHNGKLDAGEKSTTTDSNGVYVFTGLNPGTYDVKRVLPDSSYRITTSTTPVTVTAGQTVTFNIGSTNRSTPVTPPASTGTISGVLFNDDNFDGVLDNNEAINAGRVVYIDANHNGKLDAGEQQTTTDSTGKYTFANLTAGTYDIKRVLPSSAYRITTSTTPVNLAAGQNLVFNIGSTMLQAK